MFDIARMSEVEKEAVAEKLRTEYDTETWMDMSWMLSAIAVALDLGYTYYKENPEEMNSADSMGYEEDMEHLLSVIHTLQSCAYTLDTLY